MDDLCVKVCTCNAVVFLIKSQVYEGIALLKAYQVLPIAGKTIHELVVHCFLHLILSYIFALHSMSRVVEYLMS